MRKWQYSQNMCHPSRQLRTNYWNEEDYIEDSNVPPKHTCVFQILTWFWSLYKDPHKAWLCKQCSISWLDNMTWEIRSDQLLISYHTTRNPSQENSKLCNGMLNRSSKLLRVLCLLQTDCLLRKKKSSLPCCNYLSIHYITTPTTSIKIKSQSRNLSTLNLLMHKLSQN